MLIKLDNTTLSKWVSFGFCAVRSLHGYNNNATDVYIQLFEQSAESNSTVVSNGVVPKGGSLLCQGQNGFKFEWQDGISFAELCIAMSSTPGTLTLVGANAGLDLVIDVEGGWITDAYPTLTLVGDLTTVVTSLQVWSEANGLASAHKLLRVDAVKTDVTCGFVIGYAVDTPTLSPTYGSKNQFALNTASGSVAQRSFGAGFVPFEQTKDFVKHQGLSLYGQTALGSSPPQGLRFSARAMYIVE